MKFEDIQDLRTLITVYTLSMVLNDMSIKYKGDNSDESMIAYENTDGWQEISLDNYIEKCFEFLKNNNTTCRFDRYNAANEISVSMENDSVIKNSIYFDIPENYPYFISKYIESKNDLINKIEIQMFLDTMLKFLKRLNFY